MTSERYNTEIQRLALRALEVQDACNPLGVTKGLAKDLQELVDLLRSEGLPSDTPTIRSHPIFRLWASKVHDLAGMGLSDTERFSKAYHECQDLAGVPK